MRFMQIDYETIDHEQTGIGLLELRRYTTDQNDVGYEILIDGSFLMASHGSHSERAMAEMAWRRLNRQHLDLRVLIGGLGAGHTLRATLDLAGVTEVVVAEIGAKVVDWNRRFFALVNDNAVDDPRASVRVVDVVDLITSSRISWDLILLDVDNGPGWLAAPANARLYSVDGLNDCRHALRPGGVLAIWSPGSNDTLDTGLREVFATAIEVETTASLARSERESPSVIYLAHRTA